MTSPGHVFADTEGRFRAFADLTYDWEYWTDSDARLMYSSPSCERISGYTPQEFLSNPTLLHQAVHPDDRPAWEAHVREVLDADGAPEVGELEFRIVAKSGEVRWIHHYCVPVAGDSGRQIGRRASNRDITARKSSAEALRRQAMVLDQIADHVVVTGLDGTITYVNASKCRSLGVDRASLVGHPIEALDAARPELASRQRRIFDHTLQQGEWRGQAANARPDGSDCRIFLRTQLVRDEGGRPVAVCGIATDITELEQAREARDQSEATLRAAFAGMQDRVMVLDREGRRVGLPFQPAGESAGGAPRAWPDALRAGIQVALANDSPLHVAYPLEENGAVRWYSTSVSPIGGDRVVCVARDITANRQAEQELREREAKYRAAIETSADGFLNIAPDGRILEVNDAYVRRSGYPRQELLRMNIRDLETGGGWADPGMWMAQAMRAGSVLVERSHRSRDGIQWQAELNVAWWPIGGGCFFVFARDLFQRSRSEALLKIRLRLSDIAASASLDELMRTAVDEAESATGSSIGFFHLAGPDERSLAMQVWSTNTVAAMCLVEGKAGHNPISEAGVWADCAGARAPVIHNDYQSLPHKRGLPEGHPRLVRELAAPVLRDGRVAAILGVGNKAIDYTAADADMLSDIAAVAWDIIDRKRSHEALRENEERYRTVVSSTSDGIVLQDASGRILTWNRAAERVFGISAEEAMRHTCVSRDWHTIREDGSEWPGDEHPSMRTLATGQPCRDRVMGVKRPDGTTSWINVNTEPLCAEPGCLPDAVVVTFSDITARKQMEDQLRRSLQDNQALLREVHHRVKNNLAAVVGLLDLQRHAIGGAAGAQALESLQNRLRSIALVHEKLYRAESAASIHFEEYLHSLISHLRTSMPFPGDLSCEASAPVSVSLDLAVPCGMIVSELVTNALRHAFPGGVPAGGTGPCRISVKLAREESGYLLTVSDNGAGLPPGIDVASTRSLGLRLVRMLAEHQLGGEMRVSREPGACFTIRFGARV